MTKKIYHRKNLLKPELILHNKVVCKNNIEKKTPIEENYLFYKLPNCANIQHVSPTKV